MSKYSGRDQRFRKIAAQVRAEESICWLCNEWINPDVIYPDAMCFSVDHILPASTHPWLKYDRRNMHAAHLRCNRKRNNRAPSTVQAHYSRRDL